MKKSFWSLVVLLAIAYFSLYFWKNIPSGRQVGPLGREEGARVAGGQGGDAGSKASEPVSEEAEPLGAGKFKQRPGPEEVAKLRHERKRRELVARMEELKKSGFGDVHPAVKSVAQELEKLGEEEGLEAGR